MFLLTINFISTRILLNIQIYRRTSIHKCGFHRFKLQVLVFSCKFAAYLQHTILPLCQKTSRGLIKENLYTYILARMIDENIYICRFHASFSVLRAVSTMIRLTKNSCCESFSIIFEALVMPFPPHVYAKQKLFLRNYSISFIFAFQEHQKCIFRPFRKAKMQIFSLAPTMVAPTRKTYINNEFLAL